MKKHFSQYIVTALTLALIATAAFAYKEPLANPAGKNAYSYITTDAEVGIKDGNLSVYTFHADKNASLKDQSIFSGIVRGLGTDANSVVAFGDATRAVAVDINDSFKTTDLQSDTLKHAGDTLEHICGDANGKFFLCDVAGGGGETGTDLCSNLAGTQTEVPQGYTRNADGTCSTVSQYINFLGSVSSASSQALACSTLSSSGRPYYRLRTTPPFPVNNAVIYDDGSGKTFNGNSQWYKSIYCIGDSDGYSCSSYTNRNYALQIDSGGKIISSGECL